MKDLKLSRACCCQLRQVSRKHDKLVLPECEIARSIKMAHASPMSGHLGRQKTTQKILNYFYWPGLNTESRQELHRQKVQVPLIPLPVMEELFKHVAMDKSGHFQRSKSGNQCILVGIDSVTKWPGAVDLRKVDTDSVLTAMINSTRTGVPSQIFTDQGTVVMSMAIKELCKLWDINQIRTSPYLPSGD